MTTTSVLTSIAVTPYEAAVRVGWSDSVQTLYAHTRSLDPRALTARGCYLAIDINLLAGACAPVHVVPSRVLEYGVLA